MFYTSLKSKTNKKKRLNWFQRIPTLCGFPLLLRSGALSGISDLFGLDARPMDEGTRSSSGATPRDAPVLSQSERGLVWPDDDPPASVAALLKRSCQLNQSQFHFKPGTTEISNLHTRLRRSTPQVPLNLSNCTQLNKIL